MYESINYKHFQLINTTIATLINWKEKKNADNNLEYTYVLLMKDEISTCIHKYHLKRDNKNTK